MREIVVGGYVETSVPFAVDSVKWNKVGRHGKLSNEQILAAEKKPVLTGRFYVLLKPETVLIGNVRCSSNAGNGFKRDILCSSKGGFGFKRNFPWMGIAAAESCHSGFFTMDAFAPLTQYLALEYKALDERCNQLKMTQEKLAEENRYLKARIDEQVAVEYEMECRMDTYEATLVQLLNYYPLGTKRDTMDAMQSVMNNPNYMRGDLEALLMEVDTEEEEVDLLFDMFTGDIEL